MEVQCRVVSLVYIVHLLATCTCQTCVTVFEEGGHCASSGDLTLQCPDSYHVYARDVMSKQLNGGCTEDLKTVKEACSIEALGSYIRNYICTDQQDCTIENNLWTHHTATDCSSYTGEKVLYYRYMCRPASWSIYANTMAICVNEKFAGTFVQLNSQPRQLYATGDNTKLVSSECACRIEIPANSQLTITRSSFIKSSFNCDQRVVIETYYGETLAIMCPTEATTWVFDCQSHDQDIYIRYETIGQNVPVSFSLQIISSDKSPFDIQCGVKYPYPEYTSTTRKPHITQLFSTTTSRPAQPEITRPTTRPSTRPTTGTTNPPTSKPTATTTQGPTSTTTTSTIIKPVQSSGEDDFLSDEMLIILITSPIVLILIILIIIAITCAMPKKKENIVLDDNVVKSEDPKPEENRVSLTTQGSYRDHIYEEPYYATPYMEPVNCIMPNPNVGTLKHPDSPVAFKTRPHYIPSYIDNNDEIAQNPIYGKSHDLFWAY